MKRVSTGRVLVSNSNYSSTQSRISVSDMVCPAVNTEAFNIGDPHLPTPSLLKSWWGDKPQQASTLHLFPCSAVYNIPSTDLWYSVVLMPSSPAKTQIRWDLYSNSNKANKAVEEAIISQIEGMISTQAQALERPSDVVNEGQKGILRFVI